MMKLKPTHAGDYLPTMEQKRLKICILVVPVAEVNLTLTVIRHMKCKQSFHFMCH